VHRAAAGPVRDHPHHSKTGRSAIAMRVDGDVRVRQRIVANGSGTNTFVVASMNARSATFAEATAIRDEYERQQD